MDSSFLDVLHDSADDHVCSISQRIYIDFCGFFEELIDQDGPRGPHERRLRNVILNRVHVVGDHHRASAKHVARPHQHWQSDFSGDARSFLRNQRRRIARLRNSQLVEQTSKTPPVFRKIDGFRSGANNWNTVAFQFQRKIQRRLTAELHDHALRFFTLHDGQNIFQRERLEIEAVRSVVVRRDGLRIAIHHDRFEAIFAQRKSRMTAAIIKLDALSNTIRPAAQNHDLGPCFRSGFIFVFISGVEIRLKGFKFRRTGVDALEHWSHTVTRALQAHGS